MPNAQFPQQKHVFGPGNGKLASRIDTFSLQELSDENGDPIVAFTAKGNTGNSGKPQAVTETQFEESGLVDVECINVVFKVPKGMQRVESLMPDEPALFGERTDAPELVKLADNDEGPITLNLAAQITRVSPREKRFGSTPEDLSQYHGISGEDVFRAAFCGTAGNPCRYMLVDSDGNYVAFLLNWKAHDSEELRRFAKEHNFPDGPIYLAPNLIAEQDNTAEPENSKYALVYNVFREKKERKDFHRDFMQSGNDFEAASWDTIKVPIPGINIRMDVARLDICKES